MKEKTLIKSVLTDSSLIELFSVGCKVNKGNVTNVYQIITYFRFSHKVQRSKLLSSHDAIKMFHELCFVSI